MEKEVILSVRNVSKKFCRNLKKSLFYGFQDIFSQGLFKGDRRRLRKEEFWAVKDVSFELRKGECLGLIGHNGAGKSTLLKLINGIIAPDEGEIVITGRTAALIELGAGFNPILTGRENIYNNGSVLGFTRKELDAKLDEIIEFSEIDEFIDTPVQNYSSGMKVRLGFAVASNLDPDLLLIDEVLAVGDIGFRIKCYNKIASLLNDAAIIFVSHSMPQLAKISNKILLMEKGEETFNGVDVAEGIEAYYNLFPGESRSDLGDTIHVSKIEVNGQNAIEKEVTCNYGESLELSIDMSSEASFSCVRLGIQFIDMDMKPAATCYSDCLKIEEGIDSNIKVRIDRNEFSIGKFTISLVFLEFNEDGVMTRQIRKYEAIATMVMVGLDIFSPAPFQLIGDWQHESLSYSLLNDGDIK